MFTVRWKQSAVNELTSLWMTADAEGRRRLTEATNLIDRQLQANREAAGESRPGGRRIMFVGRLGILFRANTADRVVRVLQVWMF